MVALLPPGPMPDLVLVLYETGLRLGEALGLTWADVAEGSVTVRRSKNGGTRLVPLTPAAQKAVLRQRNSPRMWPKILPTPQDCPG